MLIENLPLAASRVPALVPASGSGRYWARSAKIIRFVRQGCANRPFYHIVAMERRKYQYEPCIEQLGSYDPMPNENNEKLVALNFERIRFWMGMGAHLSEPVAELFGLCGLFPIHPRSYMNAWRNRRANAEKIQQALAAAGIEAENQKSQNESTA